MTHRVLIVDDDPLMTQTLAAVCTYHGYAADTVFTGAEALDRLADSQYVCMLADIHMPGMSGLELFQKAHQAHPTLPIILMTGSKDPALLGKGRAVGATQVMEKPLDLPFLLQMLSSLRNTKSVAIVDDDPGFARTLQAMLEREGRTAAVYGDMATFLADETAAPGVLMLDVNLGGQLGLDFLHSLHESHPDTQVILITGFRQEYEAPIRMAMTEHFHAITCLYKPFSVRQLLQALTEAHRSSSIRTDRTA